MREMELEGSHRLAHYKNLLGCEIDHRNER
jgi:hypothetical protein